MTNALLDPKAWEMLKAMTGPDFLVELIDTYLANSPVLIEQIRTGLAANDAESVRRAAHSLKSNSASFGANRLADAARALEMLAKSGALEGALPGLGVIEGEYALLAPLLEGLRNEC